jgi:glycosyltransferase involved in cell wall biosynthesis
MSPRIIGADTFVHLLLLEQLPKLSLEVHAAVQRAGFGDTEPAQAFDALTGLPQVARRPTHFGPSLSSRSALGKLQVGLRNLAPMTLSLAGLARYIRAHRIQILHSSDRPRDAIACASLAALTGAKALIHVHVKPGDWMSRGVRWAMRRADAVVGVSRFVGDSLVAEGYRPERVHSVLNAIDPARWDPTLDPAIGRASLGVAPGVPLILSIARLFRPKGHIELIQALAVVKRELPGVKLAIVGSDYPEGSGTTRDLLQLAAQLGVADNVLFTGQRRDIPALLAASDVFALTSYEEPFGLVYAEAMAMKRPVIGLTNGGTPEVVDHGLSGLLSEPGDIAALARDLLRLLRDPTLRARFGAHGRTRVESRFNPTRLASDFADLYSRMIS